MDGVYNYLGCKSRSPSGCYGIEDDKLLLLKEIIDKTGAIVILTSTWKQDWFVINDITQLNKDGQYLQNQFNKYGITIVNKTIDPEWKNRGIGIIDFINQCDEEVKSFVILDDESFDFDDLGLTPNFVQTEFADGLLPEHVEKAVKILNEQK